MASALVPTVEAPGQEAGMVDVHKVVHQTPEEAHQAQPTTHK